MIVLAIRFVLELAGVAALAFVGATVPAGAAMRVVLAVGAPLALVAVWGTVVAPRADNRLPLRVRELVGTALLVLVAGCVAVAGHPGWGTAFAVAVLADQALLPSPGAIGRPSTGPTGRRRIEGRS